MAKKTKKTGSVKKTTVRSIKHTAKRADTKSPSNLQMMLFKRYDNNVALTLIVGGMALAAFLVLNYINTYTMNVVAKEELLSQSLKITSIGHVAGAADSKAK